MKQPSQYQIEQAAGIDADVAMHMMAQKTSAARTAMSLLKMQVNFYEAGGFELLKLAVSDCKDELQSKEVML